MVCAAVSWNTCLIVGALMEGLKELQNEHGNQCPEVSSDKTFSSTSGSDQHFRILIAPLKLAILIPHK